jgi:hypothetical protein
MQVIDSSRQTSESAFHIFRAFSGLRCFLELLQFPDGEYEDLFQALDVPPIVHRVYLSVLVVVIASLLLMRGLVEKLGTSVLRV